MTRRKHPNDHKGGRLLRAYNARLINYCKAFDRGCTWCRPRHPAKHVRAQLRAGKPQLEP